MTELKVHRGQGWASVSYAGVGEDDAEMAGCQSVYTMGEPAAGLSDVRPVAPCRALLPQSCTRLLRVRGM